MIAFVPGNLDIFIAGENKIWYHSLPVLFRRCKVLAINDLVLIHSPDNFDPIIR